MGATILTWGMIFFVFMYYDNKLQPANYYENQIPAILEYVEQLQGKLLLKETKQELEEQIPLEGMIIRYWINTGDFYMVLHRNHIFKMKKICSIVLTKTYIWVII